MNELKDYQKILQEKAVIANGFFTKYPDIAIEQAELFREINETKIKNTLPEIMVYGIYNAGKSSILNELIGSDVATVRDVPETDKVTYYDWQGYKLADTPGVSAPIAHENITQEHLKKADIVLFVMSTTGSNEKLDNYERMKMISDAGKKIIIVLNDKNGDMGRNDETIQLIKQKVAVNMRRVGIEKVDEKYCIVTVNAARAHKGRMEGKLPLVTMSGISELKDVVLSELKHTSSFTVLRNAIGQLEEILADFIAKLEQQENSALLKKMNHVLETFGQQKIAIRKQINLFIDAKAEMFGATLPQIIWENRSETEKLNAIMGREIENLNQKVQAEVQRQIEDTVTILSLELKSFTELKLDPHTEDAESFKAIISRLNQANAELTNKLTEDGLSIKDNTTKISALTATAGAVEIATGLLSESATAIATNLAKTTVGKAIAGTAAGKMLGSAAGAVLPVIGPVITVVSAISALGSLLGGNDDKKKLDAQLEARNEQERRRVEAEMQARQELNQKCYYLADNLASEMKELTNKSIIDTLAVYEEPFIAELTKCKENGRQIMDDVAKLRTLYDEYDVLRAELGGC